jgi:hypothetical protein
MNNTSLAVPTGDWHVPASRWSSQTNHWSVPAFDWAVGINGGSLATSNWYSSMARSSRRISGEHRNPHDSSVGQ